MTRAEATALGRRWKQRACVHLALKAERNRKGDATGKYICILCGEFFAAQAQERSLDVSR
jgi:hypothetical protein